MGKPTDFTLKVKYPTKQQLNRKLAELMGWKAGGDPNKQRDFVWWIDDHRFRLPEKWDPCSDPAASLEVQTAALATNKLSYLNTLLSLVSPDEDIQVGLGGTMEVVGYTIDGTSAMFNASPRERAEAAYITLSQVPK